MASEGRLPTKEQLLGIAERSATHRKSVSDAGGFEHVPSLPLEYLHHLCQICRHVFSHYLFHSPLEQMLEKVTLSPLELVLKNRNFWPPTDVYNQVSTFLGGEHREARSRYEQSLEVEGALLNIIH